MDGFALTTTDNPFDPFTQFDEWYNFDMFKGYNTCGRLAKLAKTSESMSDYENDQEIDIAMNEIVEESKRMAKYAQELGIDNAFPIYVKLDSSHKK